MTTAAALRRTATVWLADGRPTVVVEVVEARGSVPRGTGTRMLVSAAAIAGTIGGGHLELKAIDQARRLLSNGDAAGLAQRRFALGPSLGQCCGGVVTLNFAPLAASSLAQWPSPVPIFLLQLYGAGHVGRAIATLLATLDCEVDWFDPRDDEFGPTTTLGSPWPGQIRRHAVDVVEAEVAGAPPGACYLVLTHEHALDLRIAEAILRRGDFAYLGLIGSRSKRASFARQLLARGLDASTLARMTCPIGVAGIGGKSPEVIAAAVTAQLLQVAEGKVDIGSAADPTSDHADAAT